MNFLACDLGGTKVLLAIYEEISKDSPPKLIEKARYLSSEWESIYDILDDFLNLKCKYITKPQIACFGIAGPVANNFSNLTNLSWTVSAEEIKIRFKFKEVELINDFAVLVYGIANLKKNQFTALQNVPNQTVKNKNLHTVVGAGTGLGISRGIIDLPKIEVLSSEGGHAEFAPRTTEEWELKEWLKDFLNIERVSIERIISGEGLLNIARWKFQSPKLKNHLLLKSIKESKHSQIISKNLPYEICKLADHGDIEMKKIENIWLSSYASILGDIAVHELCYGGLWIAGGTAPKHLKNFKSKSFLKHFSNKGRYKDILKNIPIRVITDEDFGLYSAACKAKLMLKISK